MNIRYTIGMLTSCLVVSTHLAMRLEAIELLGRHHHEPEGQRVPLAQRCLEHAGLGFSQGLVAALCSKTPKNGVPIVIALDFATFPLWQQFRGYTDFHRIDDAPIDQNDLKLTVMSQFLGSYAGYFLVLYVHNALKDGFCQRFE